jgi:zinc protease
MIRLLAAIVLFVCVFSNAFALDVKEITSAAGIKAWFVERHVAPLVHVRFAFAGGSASDEKGFEGTAMLLSGMMDEGAGPYDGETFRRKIDDHGMSIAFNYGLDNFYGYLSVPIQYQAEAAELMRLALTEARFPEEAIERERDFYLSSELARQQSPDSTVGRASLALALPGHPYVEAATMALQGLPHVGRQQLTEAQQRIFVRSRLKVAIVGDMSEDQAKHYLDQLFGTLPEGMPPLPHSVSDAAAGPQLKVISADTAQTLIQFRVQGLPESDPDYQAASVAVQIIDTALNDLIREQHGMSYGVFFEQQDYVRAHFLIGRLNTANATAREALAYVKNGLRQLLSAGPSELQFNQAKALLKGQFALGFDSGSAMADVLLDQRISGFGSNYVASRGSLIDKVTRDDVRRVIAKLIDPDKLLVVAVGKPEGLTP